MIISLDKNKLYSTFSVKSFEELEQSFDSLAPSMVEYYLTSLSSDDEESTYMNRNNIQNSIVLDEYSIYLDYDENTFLEINSASSDYETGSLW
jgi:hypothetical protein